jgi:ribosomal protein S18 acetylase RimI-like enzyme
MVTIYQAKSKEDLEYARELFFEFLTWAIEKSKELYNEDIDINEMVNRSMSEIDNGLFSEPHGRLLLAKEKDQVIGIVCMKKIRDEMCEIKRIYVRPGYRGKKIGQNLLEQIILSAKEVGYSKILLDSAKFMNKAHLLYRSVGFREIKIYSETEMTENFQEHMVYMELEL